MTPAEKRAAYKEQDVTKLTDDQLRHILLTIDGRGEKFKKKVLDELLKRVAENRRRENVHSSHD